MSQLVKLLDARVEVDFIRHVVAEGKRKKRVKSESDDEGEDDEHEDLVELGLCKVKTCTDQRIDTGRAVRLHLGKACVVLWRDAG